MALIGAEFVFDNFAEVKVQGGRRKLLKYMYEVMEQTVPPRTFLQTH